MLDIIILAAGKGTRMHSDKPKVLHEIGGKPLLAHVVDTAKQLSQQNLQTVIGHGAEQIKQKFTGDNQLHFVTQEQQLGTGHAVQQALPFLDKNSTALILYGDVPLIQRETLEKLIQDVDAKTLSLLTLTIDNPDGYGRIVRNNQNSVTAIVEQKDASETELAIKEINTGILAVPTSLLAQWLPALNNSNAQKEFYLTDIIAMAVNEGIMIRTEQPEFEWEVLGVNDRRQQAELERIYQNNQAQTLLKAGVTLMDPERFDVRGTVSCGKDVIIDVNCVFEGNVTLGNGVTIGPNCVLTNTMVGDHTDIKANCLLEDTQVASNCSIGPFARLRPGTTLGNKAKIGNFVETKNVSFGEGSKANHLSYVGDASVGKDVNIGAGTITCNYDGANKHKTTIEDNVFVGSNTALVAPITLKQGSSVGAGATINKNVEEDTLVVTRPPRKDIKNWLRPKKR